ncbi:hypothetical protein, partial [Rubrimonas sp.]|uniref:hypothetical protein n=1 Tax=Rubrimonas sp. TaxID=2036015 RepID=UPI002FDD23AF
NNLLPPYRTLRPRVASIGGAAVSSLIRGSAIGDVYRLHAIAQRDGIGFHVTAVPAAIPCPDPTEEFDRAFMQCLFDFGGRLFDSGDLWSDSPPFFAARLPDPQDPS